MTFDITISAPREKVWRTLWDNDTYSAWTAPFAEGSRAATDWKKGSKILFLDGKGSGMISKVEEVITNEFMGITHVGVVKNGVESMDDEEARQWSGAYENYTLKETNGKTHLHVEMGGIEIPAEYEDYFKNTWPAALNKLKELSEKN